MQKIHGIIFSAATSLNAFWILNVCKEAFPPVKAFFNFYPVTGPLLGLYLASALVFVIFLLTYRAAAVYGSASGWLVRWYFMLSVILFFFMVFPPVYEPIVEMLAAA